MNLGSAGTVRTVTFGDLEAGVWGAVWGAEEPFVTLGRADGAELPSSGTALEGSDDGEDWRIVSDRVELTLTPAAAAAPAVPPGFDQLCRVRGRFALDGQDTTVDCLGRRGSRAAHPDFGRFESLRDVSAWFEPAEGIALVSLRPRKAAGHSDDLIRRGAVRAGGDRFGRRAAPLDDVHGRGRALAPEPRVVARLRR